MNTDVVYVYARFDNNCRFLCCKLMHLACAHFNDIHVHRRLFKRKPITFSLHIHDKNCSLYTTLTAMDKKLQKIIKVILSTITSSINVMLSN